MNNYEQELSVELKNLKDILETINRKLQSAKRDHAKSEETLRETNKDMWEKAPHSLNDFDGVVELSQFYQPMANNVFAVEVTAENIRMLERLKESPYFARIDFCVDGEETYEKFYIGRGTLTDKQEKKILIYDWRSPVAGLFYRFETGEAFYDAPAGRITGDIGLKRQYEIKDGVLEYFFDANVQIQDEFLRKMLSGNTSGTMKTIIETIQKDQDAAIRDTSHDLLMVQGIAGSGKTSVALHRVAYLKYKGLENRLKSSDIIILSPNTLFEQYISNVLPELGEEEVKSVTFDDLLKGAIKDKAAFQTRYEKIETLISLENLKEKTLQKQAMEFKMSGAFIEILNRFAKSLPLNHIDFTDIKYGGKVVFSAKFLKERLINMQGASPLAVKLKHLRDFIFERIHELKKERILKLVEQAQDDPKHIYDYKEYARMLSIEEHTLIAEQVDAFIKPDIFKLYKKLIKTKGLIISFAEGIELPGNIEEILNYSKNTVNDLQIQNEDTLAVALLQLITGTGKVYKQIRQLVIDEAQDYYDIHFEILKRMFPNARYTVLGDINQTIEKQEDMDLYERITKIMKPKSAFLMSMNKSFRCTKEILSFSMQFLDQSAHFESFNRNGDDPQIIGEENLAALDEKVISEAQYGINQGYQSVAIICKNMRQAEALFERLKDKADIHLIRHGGSLNTAGVLIIPITISKGLEFDSVLIYGADDENYCSNDDKKLLYIASTRALHRLNLFYTGNISRWIKGGGQE